MSTPLRIAFTTPLPAEGFARLKDHILYAPLSEAEVLVATFDFPVTESYLAQMPRLRLVANFGVGFNNIDLDACRRRAILVTNTPQPVVEPTAELAFALMTALARRVALHDRQLRTHTAQPFAVMNNLSSSLYGKRLGIVGMGRIGQSLARRALASGMTIAYHNRRPLPAAIEQRYQAEYTPTLSHLLASSDFVSLHLPYTPSSHHLISFDQFALMRPTAFLINTARGAHVDEQALIHALRTHQIAGAALDVFEHEPTIAPELLTLDNVLLSPHTGTGTWEGRIDMCQCVTDNILAFAANRLDAMNLVP